MLQFTPWKARYNFSLYRTSYKYDGNRDTLYNHPIQFKRLNREKFKLYLDENYELERVVVGGGFSKLFRVQRLVHNKNTLAASSAKPAPVIPTHAKKSKKARSCKKRKLLINHLWEIYGRNETHREDDCAWGSNFYNKLEKPKISFSLLTI